MFSKRLNELLGLLQVSATDISGYMKCDRSNVCRYLKGQRTPKKFGKAAWKLADGIYRFSDERNTVNALCEAIGYGEADDAESIKEHLMLWLYSSENNGTDLKQTKNSAPYEQFGNRLDSVMKLSQTSNVQLAKKLSVDPSYISRFKNGLRFPGSNKKITNELCALLLDRIYENGKTGELSELMNADRELFRSREDAFEFFYRWLYGTGGNENVVVKDLIEQIDGFPSKLGLPVSFSSAADETAAEEDDVYFGEDGLKKAVIRFLSLVVKRQPKEIFLFSNQNMDWITSEPGFLMRWAALMTACVQGGTAISIIHNIERSLEEMTDAVKSWLPLYPSGMIRSYYCKRRQDARFSSTIFLCPGLMCVSGSNVMGTENEIGMYRCDTRQDILEARQQAFDALMDESVPLIKTVTSFSQNGGLLRTDAGITVLSNRLSLATMPQKTLESILNRNGISPERRRDITGLWKSQREFYYRLLESEYIHECVPLLPYDQSAADIPGLRLSYSKREYNEHLEHLVELSEGHRGYRIFPISEPAFENIRVRCSQKNVVVSRLCEPFVAFIFEHPRMCETFLSYCSKIKELNRTDKLTVKNMINALKGKKYA